MKLVVPKTNSVPDKILSTWGDKFSLGIPKFGQHLGQWKFCVRIEKDF